MRTHILKPRLDGLGDPPSPKSQQKAMEKKKKEKKAGKDNPDHKLMEKEE